MKDRLEGLGLRSRNRACSRVWSANHEGTLMTGALRLTPVVEVWVSSVGALMGQDVVIVAIHFVLLEEPW